MRSLPYMRDSDTSREAAESMASIAPTIRQRVYQYILSQGHFGSTDDEIEVGLSMSHQTASARRRELEKCGAVYRTDERRPTRSGRRAGVYRAVPGAYSGTRIGRPLKAPEDALTYQVSLLLTQGQGRALERMARREGRQKGVAARRCLVEGFEAITGSAMSGQ